MNMLVKLLSPKAAVALAASQLGVEPAILSAFGEKVQSAIYPRAGESFDLASSALSVAGGNYAPLRALYDSLLADKGSRPLVAQFVASWLKQNDTEGLALKMLGMLNKMPLRHMGNPASSVEEFLEQGLFPLLDDVFVVDLSCSCGQEMRLIAPELAFCELCETYKDV